MRAIATVGRSARGSAKRSTSAWPGVASSAVAGFIAAQVPFDRLYYYGADRPLQVSVGPDETREVALMRRHGPRRRVPRRMTAEQFMLWLSTPRGSRF